MVSGSACDCQSIIEASLVKRITSPILASSVPCSPAGSSLVGWYSNRSVAEPDPERYASSRDNPPSRNGITGVPVTSTGLLNSTSRVMGPASPTLPIGCVKERTPGRTVSSAHQSRPEKACGLSSVASRRAPSGEPANAAAAWDRSKSCWPNRSPQAVASTSDGVRPRIFSYSSPDSVTERSRLSRKANASALLGTPRCSAAMAELSPPASASRFSTSAYRARTKLSSDRELPNSLEPRMAAATRSSPTPEAIACLKASRPAGSASRRR